jgi:T5SS/PEP-CTERM-associated repeat protein
LDLGGAIDVTYLPYASGGSASVTSSGLLTVSVGGGSYTQQLSGDYVNETFQLAPDASSGTLITLNEGPRTLVWTGAAGTGFQAVANWSDVTNDFDPAQSAPGEIDTAEFLTGGGLIGGTGTAAALLFGGLAQWVLGASSTMTAAGIGGVMVGGFVSLTSGATIVSQGSIDAISGISGQAASVTVTGIGSTWRSDGELVVGGAGMGGLAIEAGGTVTAGAGVVIANTATADGSSVNLAGTGSDLQVIGLLDVGVDGSGALSISDGALVMAGTLDAGNGASAVTNISVIGADFIVSGSATVADDGTGIMSVLNGASFTAASLTIGAQGDSSGALVVSGDGSVVNISGDLNIGTALGTGDLTIGPGATVDALVVNLQGEVVLENGELDPAIDLINQGQTAGGSGRIAAGDIVDEAVIQAGGSKPSQKLLVVAGTILGGGPWSINGTAQTQANDDVGVLQINAGGTLELTGPVLNAGSTTFTDDVTPQSNYTVHDSVVEVNFEDTTGVLKLDDIGGFSGTIAAFREGDSFVITGGTLSGLAVSGGNTLTVSDSGDGGTDRLIFSSAVSASGFSIVNGDTIQVTCFAAGTRIATETGLVTVEDLAVGEWVTTADGTREPVIWVGQRTVNCKRHPKPETVWPVRVRAGAFEQNVPVRDLYLSPDHAVFISNVLIPVKRLINGTSIVQVKRERIIYYHVELPRHAVILAEGLTVESYLDLGDRANFSDRGEMIRLFPDCGDRFAPDAAMVWETQGAAPLVLAGEKLMAARRSVTVNATREPVSCWQCSRLWCANGWRMGGIDGMRKRVYTVMTFTNWPNDCLLPLIVLAGLTGPSGPVRYLRLILMDQVTIARFLPSCVPDRVARSSEQFGDMARVRRRHWSIGWSVGIKSHRLPLASPGARARFEHARQHRSAGLATTGVIQTPCVEFVPVAPDQQRSASVAIRAAARRIVYITGVDVAQPPSHRDRSRAGQRFRRSPRMLAHLPVGMKRGEMQRDVRAQFGGDPGAEGR